MPIIFSCNHFVIIIPLSYDSTELYSFFREFMADFVKCLKTLIILQHFFLKYQSTNYLLKRNSSCSTSNYQVWDPSILCLRLRLHVFTTNYHQMPFWKLFAPQLILNLCAWVSDFCFFEDLDIFPFPVMRHQSNFSSVSMLNCSGCEIICKFLA